MKKRILNDSEPVGMQNTSDLINKFCFLNNFELTSVKRTIREKCNSCGLMLERSDSRIIVELSEEYINNYQSINLALKQEILDKSEPKVDCKR